MKEKKEDLSLECEQDVGNLHTVNMRNGITM